MKILDVVKSVGFWFILLIGVLLTILSYVLGFVSNLKEAVFMLIGSIIVAFVYMLARMIPNVDEPIFFAKKWKE